MGQFFLGVVASLVAAAIFPSLSDGLFRVLLRVFSWLPVPRKVNLGGPWESTWYVDSTRFPNKVSCRNVVVKQLRNRFYARLKVDNVDFYAHGEIDSGRYVTGVWKDNTEGGYHGSFQFIIDPSTRDMDGLWIGYSTKGTVKQGRWEWHRLCSLSG